jgi:hypothetical protein
MQSGSFNGPLFLCLLLRKSTHTIFLNFANARSVRDFYSILTEANY